MSELKPMTDKRIFDLLNNSGYTQRHIAKTIDVSESYLCTIIRGSRSMSDKMRRRLTAFCLEYIKIN